MLEIRRNLDQPYADVYTRAVLDALNSLRKFDGDRQEVMRTRLDRRARRARGGERITFLDPASSIPRTPFTVQ